MSEIPENGDEDYQVGEGPRTVRLHFIRNDQELVLKGIQYPSETFIEARERLMRRYVTLLHAEQAKLLGAPVPAQDQTLIPPTAGQYIVSLVAPLSRQEEVLGDLSERFVVQTGRFGPRGAKFWYWWCVARLVTTFTCRGVVGLLGLADLIDKFRSR